MKPSQHQAKSSKEASRVFAQSAPSSMRWRKAAGLCGGALVFGLLSMSGCRRAGEAQDSSGVKVVNGTAISPRDSAIAKSVFNLKVLNDSRTAVEKSCTAAAISEKVVLVAAHCIPHSENNLTRLKIDGKSAPVKQIVGPESLFETTVLSSQDAAVDLAALVLESAGPVFLGQEIAQIAQTSAPVGSSVRMIGFGATDLDALKNPTGAHSSGQAAIGTQTVFAADGSTYDFKATRKDLENPNSGISIAAPGDSGAPLFNSNGQLIGLLVGLSYYNQGTALDLSQDLAQVAAKADAADAYANKAVDLRSPSAQKIIQIALGQAAGSFSYQINPDESTPLLAICGRNKDNGDALDRVRGDRRSRDRLGGRDLSDFIDRFAGGRGGNSASAGRGGTSTGNRSGSSSKLSDKEIEDILNDL